MKTRAAVLWEPGTPWNIEELNLDETQPTEVLIRMEFAGLCHTDDHTVTGDFPSPTPFVGGHEGAGVVVGVGRSVTRVDVGDRVLVVPTPACGRCDLCASGRQYICRRRIRRPSRRDGSYTFIDAQGRGLGAYSQLGTFSEHTVIEQDHVYPYPDTVPAHVAAVMSCAVLTGFGSAVRAAAVQAGDVVVVIGAGGVGVSCIQAARVAGAATVIAVDPVESKRTRSLNLGATHAVQDVASATDLVRELTHGGMADSAIVAVSVLTGDMIGPAVGLVAPGGRVILAAVPDVRESTVQLPLNAFVLSTTIIQGTLLGNANPAVDLPRIAALYAAGQLKLDEMVGARYPLDDIAQGYADLHQGKNIRGVIEFRP